jgi:hypothetical protein
MKKSEAYHLAKIAVVNSPSITPESKIKVLRVLIEQKKIELFFEKKENTVAE